MGLLDNLKKGLLKTKENLSNKMREFFSSFRSVDEAFLDELEEILISSDVSVSTSGKIKDELRKTCKMENINTPERILESLKKIIYEILYFNEQELIDSYEKEIILMVGINGVGKTTSIAKISNLYKENGKSVLIDAADTFRAAACEQLEIWAKKIGCPIVVGKEGADPGSVVFSGISKFKSENFDVLICDTAGRLHNKTSLMDELKKINRVIDKNLSDYKKEILLVLDASTGQNMLNQVEEFSKIISVSGLILTKLDGTAKGGAVVSVRDRFKDIPIRYICTGEQITDICKFEADKFADSLVSM